MKKVISATISICLSVFLLVGCRLTGGDNNPVVRAPQNENLAITGVWDAEIYKVLEDKVLSKDKLDEISNNDIMINSDKINLGEEEFGKLKYKLKVVKSDYTISYENNYKVSDLIGNKDRDINVYSIIFQNNILAEFFYLDNEASYFYYQGVLFRVKLKDVAGAEEMKYDKRGEELKEMDKSLTSQGLYIALKQTVPSKDNNGINKENYRTLWISTKDGELQPIKERENIIFPRMKGIWYLEPEVYEDKEKDIYYEYFVTNPAEGTAEPSKASATTEEVLLEGNISLTRSINFISNDYVATEVNSNKSKYTSSYYEVLPIDNINMSSGVTIGDLYTNKESYIKYDEGYKNAYSNISDIDKKHLSKYLDYSNFTILRNNGKWVITGRISGVNGDNYIDFTTNLKPTTKLLNYDTLLISWKILKGINPFMVDAFTSPFASMAVIVLNNELLIYRMVNGGLSEEPLKRIPLKENEEVIMAEWCSESYVDRWGSVFETNSKVIE